MTDSGRHLSRISILERITSTLSTTRPTPLSRQISYDGFESTLLDQIQAAVNSNPLRSKVSRRTDFLPYKQLKILVNPETVSKEFSVIEGSLRERLKFWKTSTRAVEEEAGIICAGSSSGLHTPTVVAPLQKSYRKIFCVLILIGRPGNIRQFIDEEVCDADLPLNPHLKIGKKKTKILFMCRSSAPDCGLRCFQGWKQKLLRDFETSQWTFLAPIFTRGIDKPVKHHELPEKSILPYIDERLHVGGRGKIFKIKIHPDHHNFQDHQVCAHTIVALANHVQFNNRQTMTTSPSKSLLTRKTSEMKFACWNGYMTSTTS